MTTDNPTSHNTKPRLTFEEHLERHGQIFYTTVGTSMLPLLHQGRDLVLIVSPPPTDLSRGDVPLYRRDNGQYVLHRIARVVKHTDGETQYICCGDNRTTLEEPITRSSIIGVLKSVTRNGRIIGHDDLLYRLYWHLILLSRPLRDLLRHVPTFFKKRLMGHTTQR